MMHKFSPLFLSIIFLGAACNPGARRVFAKKTPHEQYAKILDDKNLNNTPEGRAWLAASLFALTQPQIVSLPYSLNGYFHSDKPRALGLQFNVKAGQQLYFTLTKELAANFVLYADLYEQEGLSPKHLLAVDTNNPAFSFIASQAGTYTLRIQPQLARSGLYSLSVAVGPSMEFPVSGTAARVGSVWGDARDGGKRLHEGIDIFAPKGTPAVAAAAGSITSVKEGGIGGKTIWLKPEGKNYSLYYAHLDEQTVQQGQSVNKGDVIGRVGNTGNAQTSSPHLHFGVYTFSGAVDPLPFVAKGIKKPTPIPDKSLKGYVRLIKSFKDEAGQSIAENTKLVPLGVGATGYLAELPDGHYGVIPFSLVQLLKEIPKPLPATTTTTPASGRR